MKKFLIFLTDSIVFGVFIGLVVIAFLVTYSLSPISTPTKNDENNYVQVSNDLPKENVKEEFIFQDTLKEYDNVVIKKIQGDSTYKIQMDFNSLSDSQSFDLVGLVNNFQENKNIKLKIVSALQDTKGLNIEILSDESTIIKQESSLDTNLVVEARTTKRISMKLNTERPINYPFELIITFTQE